jgi:hypothetical protein
MNFPAAQRLTMDGITYRSTQPLFWPFFLAGGLVLLIGGSAGWIANRGSRKLSQQQDDLFAQRVEKAFDSPDTSDYRHRGDSQDDV